MVLACRFRGSMLRLPLSGMVYCEIATRTISDNEVKEGYKTSRAARKVLRSIGELPKSLVDDLRSVLNARQEVGKESLSARRTRNLPQC